MTSALTQIVKIDESKIIAGDLVGEIKLLDRNLIQQTKVFYLSSPVKQINVISDVAYILTESNFFVINQVNDFQNSNIMSNFSIING